MNAPNPVGHVGNAFWLAMGAALVGIGLATFAFPDATLSTSLLLLVGGGFSPLVLYHIYLGVKLRSVSLPQATVDTVYYLGFLITITTLAATVARAGFSGVEKFADPAQFQRLAIIFGLGLLSTGYALFGRIQLMMQAERIESEDLGDKVDRYAFEAERVLETLRKSAFEFDAFCTLLRTTAQSAIDEAAENSSSAILAISKTAHTELATSTRDITAAIREFKDDLRSLAPVEEIAQFNDAIKSLSSKLRGLNLRIEKATESAEGIEMSFGKLKHALASTAGEMEGMTGKIGKIVEFSIPLADLRGTTAALGSQLRAFSREVKDCETSISQLKQNLERELEGHLEVIERTRASADALRDASRATTDVIAAEIERRQALVSSLQVQEASASAATDVLRDASRTWIESMASETERRRSLIATLHTQEEILTAETGRLSGVVRAVEQDVFRSSQELRGNAERLSEAGSVAKQSLLKLGAQAAAMRTELESRSPPQANDKFEPS